MKTKTRALAIIILGATLSAALAQTTQPAAKASVPAPAKPALSQTEQAIEDIKNPTSWLSWGADLRLRNEYFNNAQTLSSDSAINPTYAHLHEQDYFRFRGRVWTTIKPLEDISLNARLAAEPRNWIEPSSSANFRGPNPDAGRTGMEWRYGIVDNLNLQWKDPLDLPATLTVGRQDIFPGTPGGLGTGWLVADGTPLDGSWTFFFDAARLKYNVEELKTTIDVIGIIQNAEPDAWLPTLGHSSSDGSPANYGLTDQNEKGAILWIANRSIPKANLEGYFIYKHDGRNTDRGIKTPFGDEADILTLGGRISGVVSEHWKYSVEGAYQFGRKKDPWLNRTGNPQLSSGGVTSGSRDINAFGFNNRLTYLFNDKLNNQVYLSYEFISGDDPDTEDDEMFDILWGRWPQWSELYIPYSYIPETRTGQMGNFHRFGPGWACSPTKKMDVSLNYNLLYAAEDTPTRASVPTAFSNEGNFRGHYLQGILKYRFSRHVSGHLWSEFVFPGSYYEDKTDTMTFLRAELYFTF